MVAARSGVQRFFFYWYGGRDSNHRVGRKGKLDFFFNSVTVEKDF